MAAAEHTYDEVPFRSSLFKAQAPARYAELRRQGPIHRYSREGEPDIWIVVTNDVAREALTHPLLSKDPKAQAGTRLARGVRRLLGANGFGGNMLFSDPPDHTRLRRLLSAAFTTRRVRQLTPWITQTAHELLASLPVSGETDLVKSYTAPLPVMVMGELLGVPATRRFEFHTWSRMAMNSRSHRADEGLRKLRECLAEVIEDKRREPDGNLLSALISDQEAGRLSENELLGTTVLLAIAGQETTVNLLGNAVIALLNHPQQLARLRSDSGLMPEAVEEFLRFDPPLELSTTRFATADLTLCGRTIRRGDTVMVALGSANHDATPPNDTDPTNLDITRTPIAHLAFGHGIHHCLGAPLARLEAAIGLEVLLQTLPEMHWLDPDQPDQTVEWLSSGITRGPVTLPIRYSKAAASSN